MWPFRRLFKELPLGQRGENIASRFLKRSGLKILARNFRCPAGEADIIALDRKTPLAETICFIEVKTRSDDSFLPPESAVNSHKRRQLRNVANYYMTTHSAHGRYNLRFDIVAIVLPAGQKPKVTYIPAAFA